MSTPNLRLTITFDLALNAPTDLVAKDHETLCRQLNTLLAGFVAGAPTIAAKQLEKAGIRLLGHHHHINPVQPSAAPAAAAAKPAATKPAAPAKPAAPKVEIPRDAMIAAAPHLTDAELVTLAERAAEKAPADRAALVRHLRRISLAMVNNEFRMIPCNVAGTLTTGEQVELAAKMNLTNGSVLVDEADRNRRLQTSAPIHILFPETDIRLDCTCEGYTLSGPVIQVSMNDVSTHRDVFITRWQP